ncbi:MAG TPA: DUF1801 domain-containing protein [Candidatus Saccharibacteria bacterium]|nr:DUF1801 domain-containing protein [Candidatus Saccharibacteria bacterium]
MTVDEYLLNFDGEARNRLEQARGIVKELSPSAVESISYGLIGYKLNNRPLIYFGGFKDHIGLYATPNGHEAFKKEFSKYKQGKGSVQFPHNQTFPVELVRKVVRFRVEQLNR